MLVVQVKLSINLASATIEDVIAKMKHSHIQLINMLIDELRYAGAPPLALTPLVNEREKSERKPADWFNVAMNFQTVVSDALTAQSEVFDLLAQQKTWMHTSGRRGKSWSNKAARTLSDELSDANSPSNKSGVSTGRDNDSSQEGSARSQSSVPGNEGVLLAALSQPDPEQAEAMISTAALCSRMNNHATAIDLLRFSLQRAALAASRPASADAVRYVVFAAESVKDPDTDEPLHPVGNPWRLEALMLTDQAMQPWPASAR